MNYNTANNEDLLKYQTDRLKDLIAELLKCCDERKIYEIERFNLPQAELKSLLFFGNERYLTVTGIAQKMDVAKSRITKIIGSLAQKGLVKQMSDPQDTRIKLISLTQAGREIAQKIEAFQSDIFRQILLNLGVDERKTTLASLEMLRSAMEAVKERMTAHEQ
ncbi:MAG: MarR family transcriptional regulator [Desulfobacteraceae bacterium]|nr:MAG: MarR family transcriptional regulator [Desulfobacteraceae bacterium]